MNETCKDCGKPIHWSEYPAITGGSYGHDNLADILACPSNSPSVEPAEV